MSNVSRRRVRRQQREWQEARERRELIEKIGLEAVLLGEFKWK